MERFIDVMNVLDSVHLTKLPPMTTLLVWTMNSFYRVVVADGADVYVQGGTFFPEPHPHTWTARASATACWSSGGSASGC
jgi:hypothetical protein